MDERVVCVPITPQGLVDLRWGRAARVALATVDTEGHVTSWQEREVGWDRTHDLHGEGSHHAAIARFLKEEGVRIVVAHHMGPPMQHMLERMGVQVHLGAEGPARQAVEERMKG
jgi:predicted Fe-Mo cluster-binding NifX family protein